MRACVREREGGGWGEWWRQGATWRTTVEGAACVWEMGLGMDDGSSSGVKIKGFATKFHKYPLVFSVTNLDGS